MWRETEVHESRVYLDFPDLHDVPHAIPCFITLINEVHKTEVICNIELFLYAMRDDHLSFGWLYYVGLKEKSILILYVWIKTLVQVFSKQIEF